jgi:hypothetical protein
MNDDLARQLIDQLKQIEIAIPSINPDPALTIQAYRDQKAAQQRAADQLVVATKALVDATRRLGDSNVDPRRANWRPGAAAGCPAPDERALIRMTAAI